MNHKSSGAYKSINSLYQSHLNDKAGNLPVEDADKYFSTAVTWIRQNVSYNFTPALAENILCELNREKGSVDNAEDRSPSPKKDVLYMYMHRNNAMHHLYRWKTDIRGRAVLQVLLMSNDGTVVGIEDLTILSREGCFAGLGNVGSSWKGGCYSLGAVQNHSQYRLSEGYCQYLV